jgi:ring-1,2-phenylacetyl-CoA epoxidase subunit PaaB
MIIKSLDPRVDRNKMDSEVEFDGLKSMDQWQTYEVFHQQKRGQHHTHVGSVHAPNPEMAILFGKEQYARRGETVNLWVVKSADVFATEYEDTDIFETTPLKVHRDAGSYRVMDRINAYKERVKQEG